MGRLSCSDGEVLDGDGGVNSDCDGTDGLLLKLFLFEQAARGNRTSAIISVSILVIFTFNRFLFLGKISRPSFEHYIN